MSSMASTLADTALVVSEFHKDAALTDAQKAQLLLTGLGGVGGGVAGYLTGGKDRKRRAMLGALAGAGVAGLGSEAYRRWAPSRAADETIHPTLGVPASEIDPEAQGTLLGAAAEALGGDAGGDGIVSDVAGKGTRMASALGMYNLLLRKGVDRVMANKLLKDTLGGAGNRSTEAWTRLQKLYGMADKDTGAPSTRLSRLIEGPANRPVELGLGSSKQTSKLFKGVGQMARGGTDIETVSKALTGPFKKMEDNIRWATGQPTRTKKLKGKGVGGGFHTGRRPLSVSELGKTPLSPVTPKAVTRAHNVALRDVVRRGVGRRLLGPLGIVPYLAAELTPVVAPAFGKSVSQGDAAKHVRKYVKENL